MSTDQTRTGHQDHLLPHASTSPHIALNRRALTLACAGVVVASVLVGSGYLIGRRSVARPEYVPFSGTATVADPLRDVETVVHNGRPEGSSSFDLIRGSVIAHGDRLDIVLEGDRAMRRSLMRHLSDSLTIVEDATHPLYFVSFDSRRMEVVDSAASYAFVLGAGRRDKALCNQGIWDPGIVAHVAQFESQVRRGFTAAGNTIRLSIPRRELSRLPSSFYWKVSLREEAANSSQASFDDAVPNGKPYLASIFPDGYAQFPN